VLRYIVVSIFSGFYICYKVEISTPKVFIFVGCIDT